MLRRLLGIAQPSFVLTVDVTWRIMRAATGALGLVVLFNLLATEHTRRTVVERCLLVYDASVCTRAVRTHRIVVGSVTDMMLWQAIIDGFGHIDATRLNEAQLEGAGDDDGDDDVRWPDPDDEANCRERA